MASVVNFFRDSCCSRRNHHDRDGTITISSVNAQKTAELASRFVHWMTQFHHPVPMSPEDKLLEWLSADQGYRHLPQYKYFLALIQQLRNMGYQIKHTPSERDFTRVMFEECGVGPVYREPTAASFRNIDGL